MKKFINYATSAKTSSKKDFCAEVKRYIRLDSYFEKARVKRLDIDFRIEANDKFGFPKNGFRAPSEFEEWARENLWISKEKTQEWEDMLKEFASKIGLPDNYLPNVEMFLTLNFIGGYDVKQPGLPRKRVEDNYLRTKKLIELAKTINPKTGKRISAQKVAELFDPFAPAVDNSASNQSDGFRLDIYDPERAEKIAKTWPEKLYDQWLDNNGIFTNEQVRKIISKHKKRFSK